MKPKITVIFKQESPKNHTDKRLKHGTHEWEKVFLSPPPPSNWEFLYKSDRGVAKVTIVERLNPYFSLLLTCQGS